MPCKRCPSQPTSDRISCVPWSPLGCTGEALRVFERPRYLAYIGRETITAVILAGQWSSTAEDNALSAVPGAIMMFERHPERGKVYGIRHDKACAFPAPVSGCLSNWEKKLMFIRNRGRHKVSGGFLRFPQWFPRWEQ